MAAFRLSLAGLVAALAAVTFAARPGFLRAFGLLDGDRLADRAYRDLWDDRPGSTDAAVGEFRDALATEAASPYRWCDLAESLIEAGRYDAARQCLQRAVELGPRVPPTLMRSANAYFRMADVKPALHCTSKLLAIIRDYDGAIFSTYSRMRVPLTEVLEEGLPAGDRKAAQAFLLDLLERQSIDNSTVAWNWARARGYSDDLLADRYSAALLRTHRPEAAAESWTKYFGTRSAGYRRTNYVFNGGFEWDPAGSSFDWVVTQVEGVAAERDPGISYEGHSSLRIRFDGGTNVSYGHVTQRSVVRPANYLLVAHVRTDRITTDQGIGIRVYDFEDPARLSVTAGNVVGTGGWVTVSRQIAIRPPTRMVGIQVVREPSLKFDSAISGTAWVDGVSLAPAR